MAQYSNSGGRPRGYRGGNRESRGRRDFTEMGGQEREFSGYHTRSRDYEQSRYYSNEQSTRRYSGGDKYSEGSRDVWEGNPKNKNVEYFYRKESPFSQFHPVSFEINNDRFSCAEQYMMWNKARVFNDQRSCRLIMQATEPSLMKRYGRGVENFDTNIWDMCCRQIVQEGNTAKFSQNFFLLEKMLSTQSRYFAEASPGDKKWGIGMADTNPLSNNPQSWRGSNWLGKALNTVKYKFQLIIFIAMNGERVKEAPKSLLFDLFEIGTSQYFEKMGCRILISESEEKIFTDAPSRNRSGKKHKQAKLIEKEEGLAPNFDVPLPKEAVELEKMDTQIVSISGEEDSKPIEELAPESKKKKSPSTKRKSQQQQQQQPEYTQEKIKFKPTKITIDTMPAKSNIPFSKQISCDYIFADWARDRIFNDITILKCFMRLSTEDLQELTGNCIYQTDNEDIRIGVRISQVLVKLKTEFDNLTRIFTSHSYLIKDFECATNIPYPPTLGERVKIDPRTIMTPDISVQPDNPVRKKTKVPEDKSILFPEDKKKTTQNKQDTQNTEILQARTETPMKEDNEMSHGKSDDPLGEIKVPTDTQDPKAETKPDNPIAAESERDNIPVNNTATQETKPDTKQESSIDVEKQQEIADAKRPETEKGMEQKHTDPEKSEAGMGQGDTTAEEIETGKGQEGTLNKNSETETKQQTNKAEQLESGIMQITSVKDIELNDQQDTTNEENPQTGKEQENNDDTKLEIQKDQETTRAENTDTSPNRLDNTGASEMDVSINSAQLDEEMKKEEHEPKTKKCSPPQSLDQSDSAKRPKTDQQIVSYDASSNSDPDPAEDQNEQATKVRSKVGKKHLISEESLDNKRSKCEPQPEMNLEPVSPAENESDDPKEKPEDRVSNKTGGKSKHKKKKKRTIFSTAVLYNKTK